MAKKPKTVSRQRAYALLREGVQVGVYASLAAASRAIVNPAGAPWSAQLVSEIERDGEAIAWRLREGGWLPALVAVKSDGGSWTAAPAL